MRANYSKKPLLTLLLLGALISFAQTSIAQVNSNKASDPYLDAKITLEFEIRLAKQKAKQSAMDELNKKSCYGGVCDLSARPDDFEYEVTRDDFEWENNVSDYDNRYHLDNPNEAICIDHCWDHSNRSFDTCFKATADPKDPNTLNIPRRIELCGDYRRQVFAQCVKASACYK